MKQNFCYICGGELEKCDDHFVCKNCRQSIYLSPKPCVEIAIINSKGQILLSKRAKEPAKGKYDLPGGFVDIGDETLEEALSREIQEELGVNPAVIKSIEYQGSYISDYPWGKDIYKNLIMTFRGFSDYQNFEAYDDVEEVFWVYPKDIDPTKLSSNKSLAIIKKLAGSTIKGEGE